MRNKKTHQAGFHILELAIVIVVLGVIGFVGFKVLDKDAEKKPDTSRQTQTKQPTTNEFVSWQFNDVDWQPNGTPPACEDPLTLGPPIDVSKATAVLYPGEIRGGDFKPHGGLALDGAATGQVDVMAMRDSYLFRGSRYIEGGEVQYILDFMDSCGIFYRYDHLAILTPDVMKEADKLPSAEVDQSRTANFEKPVFFKKGTVIATEIGHAKTKNFGFDIGTYDLRQQNAASKTSLYQTDQLRISDKEQSFYAVCWWDLLPANEKSIVKSLPARGGKKGTSDYCTI